MFSVDVQRRGIVVGKGEGNGATFAWMDGKVGVGQDKGMNGMRGGAL